MPIIFITGGIKSGKSSFALNIFTKNYNSYSSNNRFFIATMVQFDDETKNKIEKHKYERENLKLENLKLIEEPIYIDKVIENLPDSSIVLLDCITIWLNNFLYYFNENIDINECNFEIIEKKVLEKVKKIEKFIKEGFFIVVSNEVNLGNVPFDKLTRNYNLILGNINKYIASISYEVYFMVSGIPLKIK